MREEALSRTWSAIALMLFALSPTAAAVGRREAEQPEIRVAGDIEVVRLVELAADKLDVTLDYDPNQVRGSVTLRGDEPLSSKELWRLANDSLESRGLTTLLRPGVDGASGTYEIVSLARASESLVWVPTDLLWTETDAPEPGYRVAVYEAQHIEASKLVQALSPILPQASGSVRLLGETDTIAIVGLSSRIRSLKPIIERIDVPGEPLVIEEARLEHRTATDVLASIETIRQRQTALGGAPLEGELSAGSDTKSVLILCPQENVEEWTTLIRRVDRRPDVERAVYSARFFGPQDVADQISRLITPDAVESDDRFRVVVDELSGVVVVTGTPRQQARVAELIARLDRAEPSARRPSRTFIIRNRTVGEVLSVLTGLIDAGVLQAGGFEPLLDTTRPETQTSRVNEPEANGSRRDDQAADTRLGSASSNSAEPASELTLTADEGTNAIIAIGEPRELDRLEQIIRELDVRQPQVQLEVLIVSLSEGDTLDLGVEIEGLIRSGGISARLSSLFGLSSGGAGLARTVSDALGFTGVILNPGEFAVVLRALETVNDGRTLSIPRIVVANNQQGVLDSVLQQPFVTTNASDTVATTAFGGTQDAGTTVTLTPRISEADHLLLEYEVSLSAFVGESADASTPPPRQQNRLSSIVTIPDNHTIALGGIELLTEADAESRLPIIGSIPGLGEIGKSRSRSASRARFYVFIRPTILRRNGFEDLKYLSDLRVDEFGIDDGWPELEPRIIR